MNINENNLINLLPLLMYNSNLNKDKNNSNKIDTQIGQNSFNHYQDLLNKQKIFEIFLGQNNFSNNLIKNTQFANLLNQSLFILSPFDQQNNNIKNDFISDDGNKFTDIVKLF
jgi:hypothetical protein